MIFKQMSFKEILKGLFLFYTNKKGDYLVSFFNSISKYGFPSKFICFNSVSDVGYLNGTSVCIVNGLPPDIVPTSKFLPQLSNLLDNFSGSLISGNSNRMWFKGLPPSQLYPHFLLYKGFQSSLYILSAIALTPSETFCNRLFICLDITSFSLLNGCKSQTSSITCL